MGDIKRCWDCNELYNMDSGEQCICCDSEFCGACDIKNGKTIYSEQEEHYCYICNDCLRQGIEHINEYNVDDVIFTQEELDKEEM